MKQVMQNYKTGVLKVEEVPAPSVNSKGISVKTKASLISAGTERTKVETAKMNIIEKAISRLDLVEKVFNNIQQEGILFTAKKAFNKLDAPVSLGYSCAGEVVEVGKEAGKYKVGDRVACVGEGVAAHSEMNVTWEQFSAPIPEGVDYEEASFVGLGAIALNAVHLAQLKVEETVAVIGLGLIGQIAVQIIKARGCRVIGIEIDEEKLSLARQFGLDAGVNPLSDDVEAFVNDFTCDKGVDSVIIAAASKNNLPLQMAGSLARNKGRVILVGAMPIVIPRKDFYEKELYFMVSRGFGSDLYYKEEEERSYPYNYEPRSTKVNMIDFLSLVAEGKVKLKPLITHRFRLHDANSAYELIRSKKERYLAIIFKYDNSFLEDKKIFVNNKKEPATGASIGFIGAGSFAQGYILPALKKIKGINLVGVSTATAVNAKNAARKFGFRYCTTDYTQILNDKNINCVFIVTRHSLHAKFVIEALKKGKHVFVEKPLCINETELKNIISVYRSIGKLPILMAGFNRRFSPFIQETKEFFRNRTGPVVMNYRINAGYLPSDHWVHQGEGGGRIVGEVCHFVDLLSFLTSSVPVEVSASTFISSYKDERFQDNVIITLKFSDSSIGAIIYESVGDMSFPRERIEIFCGNSVATIDNFRTALLVRNGRIRKLRRINRDMGHNDAIKTFVRHSLYGGQPLIPFNDLTMTTFVTFKVIEALRRNQPVKIDMRELTGNEQTKKEPVYSLSPDTP